MVHRTARVGLRLTRAQRERSFGLLRSGADVWACVLEINAWRRRRADTPMAGYQQLCKLLTQAGPGTFGELDTTGARSVLRRYSDAWFSAAARRKAGHAEVRFPRRRRGLLPVRWYHGTFDLDGRRLRLSTAAGSPPLWLRLDRLVPYPPDTVRSVTLLFDCGRLWIDVTAELPVTVYPPEQRPDPQRVAGVDPGVIHPYAVVGLHGPALLVSGRAIRAEHRMHLADTKARRRATAARAPKPGQRGSRRWRKTRRRARLVETRHRRRIRQARHEAAKTVIGWAVVGPVFPSLGAAGWSAGPVGSPDTATSRRRSPSPPAPRAAHPSPHRSTSRPGRSRTVEPAGTYPVPAVPDVIHAAPGRHQDQLARGGPPHHQGSRSPTPTGVSEDPQRTTGPPGERSWTPH
ncbi:hypothetical protein Q0Z83_018860 [Actinoplanes sichuanensis]|nr:hypothetical protein Q0Z83_018860 [Actinoplanes sichuanensis]